jgi:hypothetical protein
MQPLANKIRPQTLAEYIGQKHLVGAGNRLGSPSNKVMFFRLSCGARPEREKQRSRGFMRMR